MPTTCVRKRRTIFFDETKRMIEDTLPPILKEATEDWIKLQSRRKIILEK